MTPDAPAQEPDEMEGARDLLRRAERDFICDPPHDGSVVLDAEGIEGILPHRGLLRLVDRVDTLDAGRCTISGRYDLARGAELLAGHFPGRPIFPGVLQIEAIGQLGALLAGRVLGAGVPVLTQVLGARFVSPVEPVAGEDLIVAARVIDDGLFFIVVGQCIYRGTICSAAVIRGLPGS